MSYKITDCALMNHITKDCEREKQLSRRWAPDQRLRASLPGFPPGNVPANPSVRRSRAAPPGSDTTSWDYLRTSCPSDLVIHKRAGRLHQIDSARTFALCQLRSPSSRVQGLAKVDPGRRPLGVVGGIAGLKQVPGLQVRPGAMVKSSRGGIEDEWCCGIAHAYLVIYIVAIILAGTTGKIHLVSLSCVYPYSDAPPTLNHSRYQRLLKLARH